MEETHTNFLGGSPLNRLSWLRTSAPFLSAVLTSSQTRWVLLRAGEPLVRVDSREKKHGLATLGTGDVRRLVGPEPVFGQGKEPGQRVGAEEEMNPNAHVEAVRIHGPGVVFLGLHEPEGDADGSAAALPSSEFSAKTDPAVAAANISGAAYFALDVSEVGEDVLEETLRHAEGKSESRLEFMEPRAATTQFSAFEAAVFAEGRSMVDWNMRNKFCPGCGSPTYSLWAGWKLACSTLLPWADNTGKKPCPSAKGLNNYSHPRTDPVVIMAVINDTGDKVLLGRNRKFPNGFYSTLAGFIEPGESFEDAVKREIWEEAGVQVWGVKYHSGQPWPYPASLMVGFYAFADSAKAIRIDLDNELVDARWFTREEVQTVLAHKQGSIITRQEHKIFDNHEPGKNQQSAILAVSQQPDAPPAFRVPPSTAIAGVLIRDWASGKIGAGGWTGLKKGNL